MVLKVVINKILVIISILFLTNSSLSSQEIKKDNVFIHYQNETELVSKTIVDTVSSKLINSLSVYTFNQFLILDAKKRKKLIKEQDKSKVLTIYNTNDLFNIFLVKEICNKKFVIVKGEYKEFID